MTINGPAAVIFAMFVANAEATGVERARLGGTLQNDILKEYQAQKEFIFPPRPSLRLVADTIAVLHRRDAALASDLDLRLPHPRSGIDGRGTDTLHNRAAHRSYSDPLRAPARPARSIRPSRDTVMPFRIRPINQSRLGSPGCQHGRGFCQPVTAVYIAMESFLHAIHQLR